MFLKIVHVQHDWELISYFDLAILLYFPGDHLNIDLNCNFLFAPLIIIMIFFAISFTSIIWDHSQIIHWFSFPLLVYFILQLIHSIRWKSFFYHIYFLNINWWFLFFFAQNFRIWKISFTQRKSKINKNHHFSELSLKLF